jgi:hypothetical protein
MPEDITLVIVDNTNYDLAKFSIEQTLAVVDCKEVLTFSNKEIIKGSKLVPIRSSIDLYDYSEIILKQLWTHIETEHALIIQWDGMAVNRQLWNDDFLNYDYIGAIWPWPINGISMGNGGFSLRSRKLIEACRDTQIALGTEISGQNEDIAICVEYRQLLTEDYDIKYAPMELARQFSTENEWINPTFGFHGIWNAPKMLNTQQLEYVIDHMPLHLWKNPSKYNMLLNNLNSAGYIDLLSKSIEKIKKENHA